MTKPTKTKKNTKRKAVATPTPAAPLAVTEPDTPTAPARLTFADKVEELLKDRPVYVNSVAAGLLGLEQGSILRELTNARKMMSRFYLSERGGKLPLDEVASLINVPDDDEIIEKNLAQVLAEPVTSISWYGLEKIHQHLPKITKKIWALVQEEAAKELASGNRMAAALETTEWQRDTWQRASFLAIRNGFVEEWQPRGAIERAMIDMLAQNFSEYLFWAEQVKHRSTVDAKMLYFTEEERRATEAKGHWLPPRVSDQQAIEHAMQMMDRFNRIFLRTLRQMRDLRRYAPSVTINNPQQVNIAADGGQQVNVAKQTEPA